jgi:hypothetical protein
MYVTHRRARVVLIHASGECGAIKLLREKKKKEKETRPLM